MSVIKTLGVGPAIFIVWSPKICELGDCFLYFSYVLGLNGGWLVTHSTLGRDVKIRIKCHVCKLKTQLKGLLICSEGLLLLVDIKLLLELNELCACAGTVMASFFFFFSFLYRIILV